MKKSHSKDFAAPGGEQSEQPSRALSKVVAPGTISNDAQMGAQLTEQYQRAIGGMTEVLKFGAMMMMLREHILSTRGQVRTGGPNAKDTGVDSWLKEYAPEVKRPTAYRFLHVAESVAEAFELPAKISFIELATKSAEELPDNLQKKQLELWDFVNGTSQRSWLDRFVPPKPKGGDRSAYRKDLTVEQEAELVLLKAQDQYRELVVSLDEFFLSKRKERFELLGDSDRRIILGLLIDINASNKK